MPMHKLRPPVPSGKISLNSIVSKLTGQNSSPVETSTQFVEIPYFRGKLSLLLKQCLRFSLCLRGMQNENTYCC